MSKHSWRATSKPNLAYYRNRFGLVALLGGECARCGESDVRCLQMEHIHGGGSGERRHLKKRGGEGNIINHVARTHEREAILAKFELLCANCHMKETHPLHPKVQALLEEFF